MREYLDTRLLELKKGQDEIKTAQQETLALLKSGTSSIRAVGPCSAERDCRYDKRFVLGHLLF